MRVRLIGREKRFDKSKKDLMKAASDCPNLILTIPLDKRQIKNL